MTLLLLAFVTLDYPSVFIIKSSNELVCVHPSGKLIMTFFSIPGAVKCQPNQNSPEV